MYRKGARAERELAEILWSRGFAVVRSAGSGVSYAPDLVAVRNRSVYAFECKFRSGNTLSISVDQMGKMKEWERRSGARVFVAWKRPYNGWIFVPLYAFEKAKKHFKILEKDAFKYGFSLEVLLGKQNTLF